MLSMTNQPVMTLQPRPSPPKLSPPTVGLPPPGVVCAAGAVHVGVVSLPTGTVTVCGWEVPVASVAVNVGPAGLSETSRHPPPSRFSRLTW